MREPPASIKAWIRRDLCERYGDAVNEDLPEAMLDAINHRLRQD